MSFSGTITALITPFEEDTLNEKGLRENIRFQNQEGIDALLVLGTTGEGATLSPEEQKKVIQIASEETTTPLIVNVGDISTTRTLEKVKVAEACGANALLMIAPYYTRPSQEGLFLHFETIAKQTSLPIILYNHPKRTGVEMTLDLLVQLAKIKNIIGIKDASGSIPYAASIRHRLPDFLLFAGDDSASLPLLSIGASGLISVLSNLLPKKVSEMVKRKDQTLYQELFPLMSALQIETNPVPIKALMERAKLPAGKPRLPLTTLQPKHQKFLNSLVL